MTGYGFAEGRFEDIGCTVELRSVNSRYFNARIKLPETFTFLEQDIENLLKDNISRGTINCTIRLKSASAEALFDIDEAAIRKYLEVLGRVSSSLKLEGRIDVTGLLAVPGVIVPADMDPKKIESIKAGVLNIVREAAEQLKKMRTAEGAALAADIEQQCKAIADGLERIRKKSGTVFKDYHKKFQQKVDELLSETGLKLDEATVAREAAVFAERSDISEETARLDSHLQRFRECCREGNNIGRRLDFISQELLREANTIASKASNIEIINEVLEIKCYIDRIKEQVQNIE
jgi:uncharacterized protein (TIGR00255 family)